MTRYYFTGTTVVDGFYNTDDHTAIPDGATECTLEERDAAIEAQSNGKVLCIYGGKISPQTPFPVEADWDGEKWVADTERHNKVVDERRAEAYAIESDQLFFKEQRGELPLGTWKAKVQEIRGRFQKI